MQWGHLTILHAPIHEVEVCCCSTNESPASLWIWNNERASLYLSRTTKEPAGHEGLEDRESPGSEDEEVESTERPEESLSRAQTGPPLPEFLPPDSSLPLSPRPPPRPPLHGDSPGGAAQYSSSNHRRGNLSWLNFKGNILIFSNIGPSPHVLILPYSTATQTCSSEEDGEDPGPHQAAPGGRRRRDLGLNHWSPHSGSSSHLAIMARYNRTILLCLFLPLQPWVSVS